MIVFLTLCGTIGYWIDGGDKIVLWLILGAIIGASLSICLVVRECIFGVTLQLTDLQRQLSEIKHEAEKRNLS